jgi:benzoyl-CoA reductase subunit B
VDGKSLFALFVLAPIHKSSKKVADFYEEVRDEIKDRADNQIAAVGNERCRLIMDNAPPWGYLKILRFMEAYGVNCVANYYTFCLHGSWDILQDGTLVPLKTPQQQSIELKTREQALWTMAEFELKSIFRAPDFGAGYKSELMLAMYNQWHCNAAMLHQLRGCESSVYDMEVRRIFAEAGVPVMQFQGSLADATDFDEVSVLGRIDAFLRDTIGLSRDDE